jgi:hypothetical protein
MAACKNAIKSDKCRRKLRQCIGTLKITMERLLKPGAAIGD